MLENHNLRTSFFFVVTINLEISNEVLEQREYCLQLFTVDGCPTLRTGLLIEQPVIDTLQTENMAARRFHRILQYILANATNEVLVYFSIGKSFHIKSHISVLRDFQLQPGMIICSHGNLVKQG